MTATTIRLFLVHGDPKRLRTAELSNWTGKAVSGPRTEFEGLLAREESEKSGVYLLTGIDPASGRFAVYVGEAETIRGRIKDHLEKEFWSQVTFFVSKDENLTKAHIRYLEGKLIADARTAGRAMVVNGQSSGARLPESDRWEMEVFLEKIGQLLPVLGVEVLVPVYGMQTDAKKEILVCEIKGLRAHGYPTPNGFLVLRGSGAVLIERPSSQKWPWTRNLRQRLKDDGLLAESDGKLVFQKDVEFSSPSAAAAVVHGGHANGLTAWRDNKGKSLKEREAA
ncbi:MAG: hypothetical protein RLZZ126_558 [Pseudomonadota bacterium]|jgi:hypothetical protein